MRMKIIPKSNTSIYEHVAMEPDPDFFYYWLFPRTLSVGEKKNSTPCKKMYFPTYKHIAALLN